MEGRAICMMVSSQCLKICFWVLSSQSAYLKIGLYIGFVIMQVIGRGMIRR